MVFASRRKRCLTRAYIKYNHKNIVTPTYFHKIAAADFLRRCFALMPFRQLCTKVQNKQPPAMRVCIKCYTKNSPILVQLGCSGLIVEERRIFMANQYNSLSHTKWLCKYHIVIVPKYRRKIIYNQYRKDLQEIIRTLCKYKGVEILEGHMMPDHVHLLLSIPPRVNVSSFMGYLKGKKCSYDV